MIITIAMGCIMFALGAAVGGSVMYVLVDQGVLHQNPTEKQ